MYMLRYIHVFFLCLTLSLAGCGNNRDYTASPLTPLPQKKRTAVIDPGNGQFMDVIAAYVSSQKAPQNTQYEFTRIDLNGDGRREGIVLMKTPHKYWCEEYGCRMIVFQAHNDGFTILSEIEPVRGPLVVMNNKTNRWRDLLVRVSGRSGWDAKNVVMKFDGRSYPPQPAFQAPVRIALNESNGTKIFP